MCRVAVIGTVAAAAVLGGPLAASARPHGAKAHARSAAAPTAGAVYGGRTPQNWPVVIELNKKRTQVVEAVIGLRLTCTSGDETRASDGYVRVAISKKRRFSASFGPEAQRNNDGTITDSEGSISGAVNRARSNVSGTWQLKLTYRDAAGVVVDTCDSGIVRWSAKQ